MFNVEKCHDFEIGLKGHSRSLKVVPFARLCFVSYWCSLVNLSLKRTDRFWDIWLVSVTWPRNPGYGSLTVIENNTIWSGTHDFLLTFHSNHRPTLHHFTDKRRFKSKIANFSTPYILCSRWRGLPCNWVSAQRSKKTGMNGLPDDPKSRLDTIPAQTDIGGGSIYKVGGTDTERRRWQRDGEGLRGGVRNLYQLFI